MVTSAAAPNTMAPSASQNIFCRASPRIGSVSSGGLWFSGARRNSSRSAAGSSIHPSTMACQGTPSANAAVVTSTVPACPQQYIE